MEFSDFFIGLLIAGPMVVMVSVIVAGSRRGVRESELGRKMVRRAGGYASAELVAAVRNRYSKNTFDVESVPPQDEWDNEYVIRVLDQRDESTTSCLLKAVVCHDERGIPWIVRQSVQEPTTPDEVYECTPKGRKLFVDDTLQFLFLETRSHVVAV